MPVRLTIDFNGGTNGATIAAGGAISAVVGAPTYTTDAMHGGMGMGIGVAGAVNASTYIRSDLGANPVSHSGSIYYRPKTQSASFTNVIRFGDASNNPVFTFAQTTTKFTLLNEAGTTVATSTLNWTDQWYRFDWQVDLSTPTAPVMTWRIFATPESATPTETISQTLAATRTFARWLIGAVGAGGSSSTRSSRIDTFRVADGAEWIGPFAGSAFNGNLDLSGSGVLAATGSPAPAGSLAMSGAGAVIDAGSPGFAANGTLAGGGSIAAAGRPELQGPVSLAGTGSLAGSGAPGTTGQAGLAGSGSLAGAGRPTLSGPVTFGGTGLLEGSAPLAYDGTVTLAGAGTLTAAGGPTVRGQLAFVGDGGLGLQGGPGLQGSLQFAGAGQFTAGGMPGVVSLAALSGAGGVDLAGVVDFPDLFPGDLVAGATQSLTPAVNTSTLAPKTEPTSTLEASDGV